MSFTCCALYIFPKFTYFDHLKLNINLNVGKSYLWYWLSTPGFALQNKECILCVRTNDPSMVNFSPILQIDSYKCWLSIDHQLCGLGVQAAILEPPAGLLVGDLAAVGRLIGQLQG